MLVFDGIDAFTVDTHSLPKAPMHYQLFTCTKVPVSLS